MTLLATWTARLRAPHTPAERRAWIRDEIDVDTDFDSLLLHVKATRRSDTRLAGILARVAYLGARHTQQPDIACRALRLLGGSWALLGQPLRAQRHLRAAYESADDTERAGIASELSSTLAELGQETEALDVLRDARKTIRRGQAKVRALLDVSEATLLMRMDRSADALELFDRARRTFARVRVKSGVMLVDANRANALTNLGHYEHAERLFRRVTRYFVDQGQQATAWQCEYNHAYLDTLRGQFQSALVRFVEVRQGFLDLGDRRHVALCDSDMAEIYLRLGMPGEALDAARRAAEALDALRLTLDAARARYFAAVARRERGETDAAREAFDDLVRVFARAGGSAWEAMSRAQRAQLDWAAGAADPARGEATKARAVLLKLGWRTRAARVGLLLVDIELCQERPDSALELLDEIEEGLADLHAPWLRCEVQHGRARAYDAQGKPRRATYHALRGVRLLEQHRLGVPPDEYMAAFLHAKQALFALAVRSVLALRGRRSIDVAFRLAEQSRSRALLDLMSGKVSTDTEAPLSDQILDIERELMGLQGRLPPTDDKTRRWTTMQPDRAHADVRALRLRQALSTWSTATGRAKALPRPRSIQRALSQGQALIEYTCCGDQVLAFVVRPDGTTLHRLPLGVTRLAALIRAARFEFERPTALMAALSRSRDVLVQAADAVLSELYDALIAPLGSLEGVDQFVVVPAGPMHTVPFGALRCDGRYWFDDASIVMAPSAAVWLRCQARTTSARTGLLALGVPDARAPRIGDEVQDLAREMPGTDAYTGAAATSDVLRTRGPHASTIHLAMHAVFDSADPMQSGLLLGDGWLTVADLYRFRLNADLLVLSGCSTARAAVDGAEDPLGFARGFLGAGVARMVASLWAVDDAVAHEWMLAFYRSRRAGLPAASCVRAAAQAVRARHPHPSYWAPFVLIGTDDHRAVESD